MIHQGATLHRELAERIRRLQTPKRCIFLDEVSARVGSIRSFGLVFAAIAMMQCTPVFLLARAIRYARFPQRVLAPTAKGTGDTSSADGRYQLPCAGGDASENDQTWQFTPPATGVWRVRVQAAFDSVLAVYDDPFANTPLRCVDDEDGRSSVDAAVTLELKAGQTYFLVVAGYQGDHGQYALEAQRVSSP